MLFLALPVLSMLACDAPDKGSFGVIGDNANSSDNQSARGWSFTDIALDLGIQDQFKRNRGAAGADFDSNGSFDILLSNPYEPPTLYLNDQMQFTKVNFPDSGTDTAPAIADYDGDGDLDVYVSCGGWDEPCPDLLVRNDGVDANGNLIWTDQSDQLFIDAEIFEERPSFGATWVDWDNDGDLDIHVSVKDYTYNCSVEDSPDSDELCKEQKHDYFFRNDRENGFQNIASSIGVDPSYHTHQAAWLDYDLDGDLDIYLPVYGDFNCLLQNNGDGTFTDVTATMGLVLQKPITAFGAVSEDFNHDGYPDLLVSAFSITDPDMMEHVEQFESEPHRLFINDGGVRFVDKTPDFADTDLRMPTMGFQVGDIDLDGHHDVVFGNGNPIKGFRNAIFSLIPNGEDFTWVDRSSLFDYPAAEDTSETDTVAPYPYRSHGLIILDFDGDRDIDIFVGNGGANVHDDSAAAGDLTVAFQREPNRFFRNDSNSQNGWIDLEVVGADLNIFAIGAQVDIRSETNTEWRLTRYVRQNSGFNSSRAALPLVGIGEESGPFSIVVTFPSGRQEREEGVFRNSSLTISEQ